MKSSMMAVRALLEGAELVGIERARLLAHAGFDAAVAIDPYAWVDDAHYDRLLCSVVELSGDPAFGLRWAEASRMLQLELIPLVVANATTLRQGIQLALQMHTLLHDPPHVSFVLDGNEATLRAHPGAWLSETARRVVTDFTMMCFKQLIGYLTERAADASFAFVYEAGAQADDYARAFDGRARFSEAANEVRFRVELLDLSRSESNSVLLGALTTQIDQLKQRMTVKRTYVDRVRAELRDATVAQFPEMAQVAQALGMSERSLRRRLADEGTSFTELLERHKIDQARELLLRAGSTVKTVAYELGFDTPSGFHRAFRRWTGQSPAQFRREKRAP